jgi:hypothetical protein
MGAVLLLIGPVVCSTEDGFTSVAASWAQWLDVL